MGATPVGRRGLRERLRRFMSSAEQLEAADLEQQARACGAIPISEAEPRAKVVLRGTISSVTTTDAGWLEVELNDGTGTVRLVWMGQRRLECILPGRHLKVTGRLSEEDDKPVIYNPEFEVVG